MSQKKARLKRQKERERRAGKVVRVVGRTWRDRMLDGSTRRLYDGAEICGLATFAALNLIAKNGGVERVGHVGGPGDIWVVYTKSGYSIAFGDRSVLRTICRMMPHVKEAFVQAGLYDKLLGYRSADNRLRGQEFQTIVVDELVQVDESSEAMGILDKMRTSEPKPASEDSPGFDGLMRNFMTNVAFRYKADDNPPVDIYLDENGVFHTVMKNGRESLSGRNFMRAMANEVPIFKALLGRKGYLEYVYGGRPPKNIGGTLDFDE